MARAVNINASETDIDSTSERLGIEFRVVERLVSGGTTIVLNNARDTDATATPWRSRLLSGPVRHTTTRLSHGLRGEPRLRGQEGG